MSRPVLPTLVRRIAAALIATGALASIGFATASAASAAPVASSGSTSQSAPGAQPNDFQW